jgi:hypothetical protein
MLQSSLPIIRFLTNKIQSTDSDFGEYLIDVATIFSEFDGQIYDRDAVAHRFLQLSGRSSERDPSFFRDKFSAYGSFLGLAIIEREREEWVLKLSGAASQLLCGNEPNVRAFSRVQLSLLQYPFLVGTQYKSSSVNIVWNARKSIKEMIEAQVKVVPLRLILRALKVKSEIKQIDASATLLNYKEIFFLFNSSFTNQNPNPSDRDIERVLELTIREDIPVPKAEFKEFYRNFHFFETTGLIKRFNEGLRLNLYGDLESTISKQRMADAITSMTTFCEEFYKYGSLSIEDYLNQMAYHAIWSKYYDGSNLPQNVYSCLTGDLCDDQTLPNQVSQEYESEGIEQTSILLPSSNLPPLTPRQSSRPVSPTYKPNESNTDPEVTRLKRQKSNTYHRFLVEEIERRLKTQGCEEPEDNVYIDLAGEINHVKILFEMKSCNPENVIYQIRKAVSQVYEYRYRYSSYFPQESTLLCIVVQERPDNWWLDYLIKDRGINIIWLEGDVNLACSSDCNELIQQLVDRVEY